MSLRLLPVFQDRSLTHSGCRFFGSDADRDDRSSCVKKMKHRHQFEAEVRGRFGPGGSPLPASAVVSVLGWHTPPGEPLSVEAECTVEWDLSNLETEEWDESRHGEGTKVVRKSDGRRGVRRLVCEWSFTKQRSMHAFREAVARLRGEGFEVWYEGLGNWDEALDEWPWSTDAVLYAAR